MLLELVKTILQVLHDIDTFTALLAEHLLFYFQGLFRGSDFPSIFKVRSWQGYMDLAAVPGKC